MVIFLDTDTTPLSILQGLSANFNQPMASFVKPIQDFRPGQKVLRTDIRYVASTGQEVPLCGHGSLAAAKAIVSLPEFIGQGIEEVQLKTTKGITVTIRVVGELLEMELPAAQKLLPVEDSKEEKIRALVNKAFGRDVKVNKIMTGGEGFEIGEYLVPERCAAR